MTPTQRAELTDELRRQVVQAICGEDHLACGYPTCGCKATPNRAEAALVIFERSLAAAPSAWRDIRLHIQRILQTKGMGDFGVRQALDEIETILFPPPIPGREGEMSNGSE